MSWRLWLSELSACTSSRLARIDFDDVLNDCWRLMACGEPDNWRATPGEPGEWPSFAPASRMSATSGMMTVVFPAPMII